MKNPRAFSALWLAVTILASVTTTACTVVNENNPGLTTEGGSSSGIDAAADTGADAGRPDTAAIGSDATVDMGVADIGASDASKMDAGGIDGSLPDVGALDGSGNAMSDAGLDATPDAGPDAGPDANPDAGPDATPDAGPDADADAAAPRDAAADAPIAYPAPHPAPPQIVTSHGPVLATPKIYAVTFPGDDPAKVAALDDLLSKLAGTPSYTGVLGEYGVGAPSAQLPIRLTTPPSGTLDDTAIQSWLKAALNGNDPAFPTADANTLFVILYPSTTTITASGQNSCQSFAAYHYSVTLDAAHGNTNVAYVVSADCPTYGSLTGTDALTAPTSLEILNAATDPYPAVVPAWSAYDNAHAYWGAAFGSEIGFECTLEAPPFAQVTGPHAVARYWSNSAALAGHDWCSPLVAGAVNFNAAPVLPDTVLFQSIATSGITIAMGTTKVVKLALFSDAPTPAPWTVSVVDYSQASGGAPNLSFMLDRNTGVNGDQLNLSITALTGGPPALFYVTSKLGTATHLWAGVVGH